MNRKILVTSIILLIIALLFIPVGLVMNKTVASDNLIFKGVYVNGVNVGGLTQEDARKLLDEKYNKNLRNIKMNLLYEDKNYVLRYTEVNAHYDIDKAINEAFNYGKTGNIIKRTLNRLKLLNNVYNIQMDFSYDETIIGKLVKKVAADINKEAVNASISIEGGIFKVTPDKSGLKVNEKKLVEEIKSNIKPEGSASTIEIPVDISEASVKASMLSNVNTKLSSFTTFFKMSDENRTGNIKIASAAVNGTVIMPGEVYSMNKTLGPRVIEKGYKEAPVIISGKVVPGLAGGICQVTTTVYNAALLADLPIVERSQHGLTVSYVGPGRDATISGDYIDLKFRNSNQYPIYIQTVVSGGSVTVNIYGANEFAGRFVELSTEVYERVKPDVEYINDPTLEKGTQVVEQKPITGIKARTFKKVYINKKLIKTQRVSQDFYKPVNGKIRVGTKSGSHSGQIPATP